MDTCSQSLPSEVKTDGEKVRNRLHILAAPPTGWVDFRAEAVLIRVKGEVMPAP